MVDQANMNGAATRPRPAAMFRDNVTGLIHDVVELGELQTQLLAVDLSEAKRRSVLPIVLLAAGLLLALGAVPVLLLSIAWSLVSLAGWSVPAAFALTAVVALCIAAITIWAGWRRLNTAATTLSRSKEEFLNNVRWIKSALRHRRPSAPPRSAK